MRCVLFQAQAPLAPQIAVLVIVALAFTSETALGFGATIITVALGSFFMPLNDLLPAFVPLNVGLSVVLVARTHSFASFRTLGLHVLPWMLLGLPLGIIGARRLPEEHLKLVFGVFVVMLAAIELTKKPPAPVDRPTYTIIDRALLGLGGIVHGAFATGGPMVVFVLGRTIGQQKAVFRATLSVLWLVLNTILLVTFIVEGRISGGSTRTTLFFAGSLAVGFGMGELLFRRVSGERFRSLVFAMLGAAGALMIVTTLRALVR